MSHPTPSQIREARRQAGHTQTEACAVVHRPVRTWQQWESGGSPMDAGLWELYLLKTGLAKYASS